MSNSSVNISVAPFEFYCSKEVHVGGVWIKVAEFFCFFLGTPAHSWFLWFTFHDGWKIKPTQVFPVALTVMDLLFCIHLLLEILHFFVLQNGALPLASLFIFGLSWGCICIEQYLAVIYPVTFLRYKGIQYRMASVAAACLLSSGYGLLLTSAVVEFPDRIFLSVCFVSVIAISFCCMSVLHVLKHPGPGERQIVKERGRDVRNQQKRNAFEAIATVLLMVLLRYIPLVAISIFYWIEIDKKLMYCELVPVMTSVYVYGVMVPPLLQLYKGGYLKCINNRGRNQKG